MYLTLIWRHYDIIINFNLILISDKPYKVKNHKFPTGLRSFAVILRSYKFNNTADLRSFPLQKRLILKINGYVIATFTLKLILKS